MKYAFTTGVVIFVIALGVRFLTWQDNRHDISKVQTAVTDGYKESAHQLAAGDFKTFVSDLDHMGHPPGYSILLAAIFKVAGDSNHAIQGVQIVCDAVSVVVLFAIALKLVPTLAAVIAALLAAISPQFAYFSVLLLPDSLSVLPILLAVYFLIRAREEKRLVYFAIAGALIGVSCWLRANALLLAPLLAACSFLFVERGKRFHAAAAILGGAVVVIAPITIKNAIVFHRFIPVSLGAGQTLLEGIADYDDSGRFNIPKTDLGIMRQEAEWYDKPEYAQLLFGPDGVERDRQRVRRGLGVIATHPVWFAGVVARRGIASTRLDPVPVIASDSPVLRDIDTGNVVWSTTGWTQIRGDESQYGNQRTGGTIDVITGADYVFRVPIRLEEGRVLVKVTDAGQETVLASSGVDLLEGVPAEAQPVQTLTIPFATGSTANIRLVIANNAASRSVANIGPAELLELGPSSQRPLRLRFVRMPLGALQQIFKSAWMLPLVVIGLLLFVRERRWSTLGIILVVPLYYLSVQSLLHTERRYVYVIHFFFLILVGYAIAQLILLLARRRGRKPQTAD